MNMNKKLKNYTEKDKELTRIQEKLNSLNSQFENIKETFIKSFIAAEGDDWDNKQYLLNEYDRLAEEIKKSKREQKKIELQIFLLTPNITSETEFDPETEKCINLADSSGYILDNPKKRDHAKEKFLKIVAQKKKNMATNNKNSSTSEAINELNILGEIKEREKEEEEEEDEEPDDDDNDKNKNKKKSSDLLDECMRRLEAMRVQKQQHHQTEASSSSTEISIEEDDDSDQIEMEADMI